MLHSKRRVIGLAGMEGSGQGQILRALAGIVRPSGGHIYMRKENDQPVDLVGRHYFDFKEAGISFLPACSFGRRPDAGLNLNEHFISGRKTGRVLY